MKRLLFVFGAMILPAIVHGHDQLTEIPADASRQSSVVANQLPEKSEEIVIPRDTPVHLMVLNEVSTKDHVAGHRFKLRVDKPVEVGGVVVIPVATPAWGELMSAESSGNLGKAGSLVARLTHVDLNGTMIRVTGDTTAKGRTATAETVVAVLGMGLLGLFAKGNNAKIKAGERITGFVEIDTPIKMPPK